MVSSVAGTRGSAQAARNPEDASGHNGQMKARDHQHVKGAGALKAHAQRMGQVGAVAGDHGGQHDGVVLGEAQRRGQPASWRGQGQQAARRAHAAACSGGRPESAPPQTGQDAPRARRSTVGCGSDALVEQIIRAAPDAGIAIDLRRQQADRRANALAAIERAQARRPSPLPPASAPSGARRPRSASCASALSVTASRLETRRSISRRLELGSRCSHAASSFALCSVSSAPAPASTTVLPRCAAGRQRAQPARARAPAAAPSARTMRPAGTTG